MASLKQLQKTLAHNLRKQAKFGESKHKAKQEATKAYKDKHGGSTKGYNPSRVDGIYSIETMKTYIQSVNRMATWMHSHGIKNARDITPDRVKEYLQDLQSRGYSAWTTSTYMAAANKCFDYRLTKKEVGISDRRLADIKRSRNPTQSDKRNFAKFEKQINFSKACGCRRQSVDNIQISNLLRSADGRVVAVHLHEKGGKDRIAPILNADKDKITAMVNERISQAKADGTYSDNMKLFTEKYHTLIDNHAFRAEYAQNLIKQLQEERNQGVALCQGDWQSKREINVDGLYKGYDKGVALAVSEALGHERLDVLNHYV